MSLTVPVSGENHTKSVKVPPVSMPSDAVMVRPPRAAT